MDWHVIGRLVTDCSRIDIRLATDWRRLGDGLTDWQWIGDVLVDWSGIDVGLASRQWSGDGLEYRRLGNGSANWRWIGSLATDS